MNIKRIKEHKKYSKPSEIPGNGIIFQENLKAKNFKEIGSIQSWRWQQCVDNSWNLMSIFRIFDSYFADIFLYNFA